MFNFLNSKLNDEALLKVENIFIKINTNYLENKRLSKFGDYFIEDQYAEIGNILSDRFGVNLTIENSNSSSIHIYPSISQYTINIKNRIKKAMEKAVVKKGLNDRNKTILYTLDKIEQELRTGLKIDTENMVILSKNDLKFNISLNYNYIIKNKLNHREIVAILLHEIGHIFNGLLLLPTTVANASDLMYGIIGNLQDNKDINETVLKITDNKNDETITSEIVFNMYKSYTIDRNQFFTGYNTSITHENSADLFAAKFNYSSDLASALVKIGDGVVKSDTLKNTILGLGITITIGLLIVTYGLNFVLLVTLGTIASLSFAIIFMTGTIAFLVWLFSRVLGTSQLEKDKTTHENVKTRIDRLKNKVISLAKNSTNKEEAVTAIKEIKSLNGLLNNINDTFGIQLKKIISTNSEYTVITLTDKLINNELFIQSLRLKYLKGE